MAANVRDTITAEGKKFEKLLKELGQLEVRIGIQQGEASEDGVDLVDIAMFNELGTVHIPSRPFLRDSVDANADQINSFLQSMKKELLRGGSAEDVLKKIGTFQEKLILEQLKSAKENFVANSPETIRRKSKNGKVSDVPLHDTGRLSQSIHHVIRQKGGSD